MRYSKVCCPHAVLIADLSSLEASASATLSRKLSTGFFDPTGALFAGVTFFCFDGKYPLRELLKENGLAAQLKLDHGSHGRNPGAWRQSFHSARPVAGSINRTDA